MKNEMRLGVLVTLTDQGNPFERLTNYKVPTAQLVNWDMDLLTTKVADKVCNDLDITGIQLAAFWAGYSGRPAFDIYEGPNSCGIVPPDFRSQRIVELKKGADFAVKIGAPAIVTHCGFIPENPKDQLYLDTLDAVREIAEYCGELGIGFWFETGQETPITLLRVIEDLELPNIGVNLDTANLMLTGRGNTVDAIHILNKYIRNLHIKDGLYPVASRANGKHTPVGEGVIDFNTIIKLLYKYNFHGELVVEREITGEQQARDIVAAINYIENLLEEYKPVADFIG